MAFFTASGQRFVKCVARRTPRDGAGTARVPRPNLAEGNTGWLERACRLSDKRLLILDEVPLGKMLTYFEEQGDFEGYEVSSMMKASRAPRT